MCYPKLNDGKLVPVYSGIWPKLYHPDSDDDDNKSNEHYGSRDFVKDGPNNHGMPGLINLLGVEIPGLTSNFAIGNEFFFNC